MPGKHTDNEQRGVPIKNGSSAVDNNHTMFQQAFRNIDDVLWKEAGCTTELDYTEQTSWLLFLKYLDDLEQVELPRFRGRGFRTTRRRGAAVHS